MEKKGKVTLEELADKIGISRTTIYKILNDKGKVSDETRKKVLDAVQKYNYVPNLAAKNLALNKQYEIAFCGYNNPRTPYTLNNLIKGIRWAADELSDYGLSVTYSLTDYTEHEKQISEIYRLAEAGVDAFAIYPNRVDPMGSCIDTLIGMGRKVFTINRDVPFSDRNSYVGCNYYQSGILAAEVLARMVPPGKEIAVLLGGDGVEYQDVTDRYQGLLKKMERFPEVTLIDPFVMPADTTEALQQYVEELIAGNRKLGGILDITYELDLIGSIVHRHNNSVRLVGFDLCDTIRNNMINHSIDAVIFQDMISQGYQGIKSLFQALMEDTGGYIRMPKTKLDVVYEGNLEFFI